MPDWTITTLSKGVEKVSTVTATDLETASALAQAGRASVVSVVLVDPAVQVRDSAAVKLRALGLTAAEATEISGA